MIWVIGNKGMLGTELCEVLKNKEKLPFVSTDLDVDITNQKALDDFAENMANRHIPLTMEDWEKRLNSFIEMFEYGLLQDAGKVTAEIAKLHAETEFEKYRVVQDQLYQSDFDRFLEESNQSEISD